MGMDMTEKTAAAQPASAELMNEDHPLALALAAREQADRAVRAAALNRWRGLDGEQAQAAAR